MASDPTFSRGIAYAASIDLADGNIASGLNTGNDYRCNDWHPRGVGVIYDESGGMTSMSALTIEVQVGGESSWLGIYTDAVAEMALLASSITATGNYYFPLVFPQVTTRVSPLMLSGIDAIRAKATVAGTPAAGDVLKVIIVGVVAPR
jgi:hypothetical protein